MMIMIDNYDSFTYNLVQYFGELGQRLKVFRNDQVTLKKVEGLRPSHIVISPGPGRPENAGMTVDLIRAFAGRIPILGVCLGHQAICYAFGGKIVQAKRMMHGKTSEIIHDNKGLFQGLPQRFQATRYHSLLAEPRTILREFVISAKTDRGEVMGVRHKRFKALEGVQFHPESILTDHGKKILMNFLRMRT
ncbi:MAG: aminodeoxychorismate/anthranilate synthase component II [Elusimicrobia bacterium]|nr:aminodeoxychorismate/anthranilate synthase component II [Candidatus Obscuribacterium magneticum]